MQGGVGGVGGTIFKKVSVSANLPLFIIMGRVYISLRNYKRKKGREREKNELSFLKTEGQSPKPVTYLHTHRLKHTLSTTVNLL